LLLCASTVRTTLAGLLTETRQTKDAERRDNVSVRVGRDTRLGQSP
jgi:hypothetical protein